METKRVLFIGIGFYDYENSIIKEFESLSYTVDYFSETPDSNFKSKLYSRLNKKEKLDEIKINHSTNIANSCGTDYDLVFVIKCDYLTSDALKLIRKKNPKAKFILYLWDSLARFQKVQQKFSFFDKIYSFDRIDCEGNTILNFNPLFYRNEYNLENASTAKKKDVIGLYHLGWYHSDRLVLIKKISKFLKQNSIDYKMILYTGYPNYFIQKILGGELKGNKEYLIFKPVSASENFKNISLSKATLDIAHPMQSGLTMRTIELLSAQKKIITTNADIINYDFYNSDNIMIIDRYHPIIDLRFFSSEFKPIEKGIIEKYSIGNWLKRMI